jgi:hypothetical protein
VDDANILHTVTQLVEEEHQLREQLQRGTVSAEQEQRRLEQLEMSLDQCWDLLRQRRAKREAGQNPDEAGVRPVSEVEGYRQ